MDEDRIAGTARKLGGKLQEDVGRRLVLLKTYIDRSPTPPEILPQPSTSGSATPSKHSHIRPL